MVHDIQLSLFATSRAARALASRILVVDDDDGVRRSLARTLRDLEYEVLESGEGTAALALLQGDEPIDALVTDVQMPGMRGDELARRARAQRPRLPVVFVSGDDRFAHLGSEPTGRSAFLPKPIDSQRLQARLHTLLRVP